MNVLEYFKPVTTFVFDVDGVLTDGSLLVMPGGLMARRMNIKDGYALQLAVSAGYRVVVISGGNSPEVQERLENLGVKDVFMRVKNKWACLSAYMQQHSLRREEILFMGDDIPDYEVMQNAGLPASPADGVTEIRDLAVYISPFKGGEGCCRDVIEKVLKINGQWQLNTQVPAR